MFGLFKKKTEIEKLQEQYSKLMNDYHKLSTTNRKESDKKYAEANIIAERIEKLNK
ncbi:hypothetical protein ULMS_22560 [Patiriisocius marinistellae]|uniref:Lacal_2735 family protein n=1 Tax=Patiriisocius marinistellae TaxID=2494560 RepID=A0A5J4FZA6_9FLAO|nr:Lacal_2735 family protein [Patiriisocius marinistellae]GEQ86748.1 hypothetical protein ULMS_22560 [Patiriisocius marinistellae]